MALKLNYDHAKYKGCLGCAIAVPKITEKLF